MPTHRRSLVLGLRPFHKEDLKSNSRRDVGQQQDYTLAWKMNSIFASSLHFTQALCLITETGSAYSPPTTLSQSYSRDSCSFLSVFAILLFPTNSCNSLHYLRKNGGVHYNKSRHHCIINSLWTDLGIIYNINWVGEIMVLNLDKFIMSQKKWMNK